IHADLLAAEFTGERLNEADHAELRCRVRSSPSAATATCLRGDDRDRTAWLKPPSGLARDKKRTRQVYIDHPTPVGAAHLPDPSPSGSRGGMHHAWELPAPGALLECRDDVLFATDIATQVAAGGDVEPERLGACLPELLNDRATDSAPRPCDECKPVLQNSP